MNAEFIIVPHPKLSWITQSSFARMSEVSGTLDKMGSLIQERGLRPNVQKNIAVLGAGLATEGTTFYRSRLEARKYNLF